MGYGDFKLLAALGAWFGLSALPTIVLLSSLVGAVIGIALIVTGRQRRETPMPFGPFLAGAGLIHLFYPDVLIGWIAESCEMRTERYVVGITGGIGSGKSAVTDHLETKGITVVDADKVARVVVEPGTSGLAAIAEHFGSDILLPDGSLDRAALRKVVFDNADERKVLEGITHPRIREEIARQLSEASSPYVVLASPLLLESGQNSFANYVVVVDVPESVQLSRTMARDDNSEQLVKSIMAAQLDRETRLSRADTSISNDGSLDELYTRVDDLHDDLLARAGA